MRGAAAQIISSVSMSGDAFYPAWNQILQRFDDKERLILAHVDRLCSNTSQVKRTAHDLHQLVTDITEIIDALKAMGVPVHSWNYVLQHLSLKRLDASLRESWEVKRSSSMEPLTFDQLIEFIKARAKALEVVQTTRGTSSSVGSSRSVPRTLTQQPRASHQASRAPLPTQYPCDHCGGQHYIVSCLRLTSCGPLQGCNEPTIVLQLPWAPQLNVICQLKNMQDMWCTALHDDSSTIQQTNSTTAVHV
ncbi:hypothetical protein WN55_02809 [Dufourea novaeangliae]|uniref:Uncharacterized protein n=1 Tax=Dufourea novaeangliae TaxID=178035 RepID=A0A154PJG4_DUFNO|nr:hypothetical protein WN55_02809 [Dufourea novaeangliae]